MPRKFLVLNVLIINLVVAFLVYKNSIAVPPEPSSKTSESASSPNPASTSAPVPAPTPESTAAPTYTSPPKPKTRIVSYIAVGGSVNSLSTSWEDVPGSDFYLKKSDYPGLTGAYFEANIKLMNGNGKAFVRIYDATNGREVDNSTLETSSQSLVAVTGGPLVFWEGNNLYRIQIRTLTADTAIFNSGRIKMITEN